MRIDRNEERNTKEATVNLIQLRKREKEGKKEEETPFLYKLATTTPFTLLYYSYYVRTTERLRLDQLRRELNRAIKMGTDRQTDLERERERDGVR